MLHGKKAVVTGSGSGIGRVIAQVFARHHARVVVSDLNPSTTTATLESLPSPNQHYSFPCDVSDPSSVREFSDYVKRNVATLSILVNCAGIAKDSTILKMTPEKWEDVLKVNLSGVFHVTQAFVKSAVENKNHSLSIVNVSSIVARTGSFGVSNYSASKTGVIGFTKSAAKELARKNVRVNAILPGYCKTPMTEAMPSNILSEICKSIPMGRMGDPEEIANAVLFLASDLSSYVTGATLEVTGGYNM